jgi:hypothetical protein
VTQNSTTRKPPESNAIPVIILLDGISGLFIASIFSFVVGVIDHFSGMTAEELRILQLTKSMFRISVIYMATCFFALIHWLKGGRHRSIILSFLAVLHIIGILIIYIAYYLVYEGNFIFAIAGILSSIFNISLIALLFRNRS